MPLDLAKQLTIERVVYSGGGAKGTVYPGANRALKDTHVLKTVKEVAGSSVGALTAAIVAMGVPVEEQRKILDLDFDALLGKRIGVLFGKNPYGTASFTRDGKPLEDYIRQLILTSVRKFIARKSQEKNWAEILEQNTALNELIKKISGPSPVFTFSDLSVLTQLFPEQFKSLTVTAVECDGGKFQLFNSALTPDVEVALACRASASLPLVLQPVPITINGKINHYMDGGVFDNLPANYFDCDATGKYVENRKKMQTLVFAFTSANEQTLKNALHGQYLDDYLVEMIVDNLIKKLMDSQSLTTKLTPYERYQTLLSPTPSQVKAWINEIPPEDRSLFAAVIKLVLVELSKLKEKSLPKKLLASWSAPKLSAQEQVQAMGKYIIQTLTPQMYAVNVLVRLSHDYFVKTLGRLNINYELLGRKEEGYHNLRRHYPLRTINLSVADINAVSFKSARKHGRVLDSFGYLDTLNHIANHNLANQGKNCEELSQTDDVFYTASFYEQLIDNFQKIYGAVLLGAGKNLAQDPLLKGIETLKTSLAAKEEFKKHPEDINIQVYYFIRAHVEKKLHSVAAFALSRSVEFITGLINAETLFRETYRESFAKSHLFAQSKITGERTLTNVGLKKALMGKNMFQLFTSNPHPPQTRRHLVYSSLQKMERFDSDPEHVMYCVNK